ncbi:MAG TPA: response regulator transcription factor [Chthoniobacterales bacterium]
MRILLVEDDKQISRFIVKGLREKNFSVDLCENGDEAYDQLLAIPYDAAILDIMLPGRDGISIVRQLRKNAVTTPVLLLTARGAVSERVEGLYAGADDYLAKPFAMDELVARVHALLRRSTGEKVTRYSVGDLSMDLARRTVRRSDRKIDLTSREFSLLECLLRNPGHVLTRTQLCEHVWEYHFDPGTNLVDVYIQRLRRKIDDGFATKLIQTVRGAGYCISEAS